MIRRLIEMAVMLFLTAAGAMVVWMWTERKKTKRPRVNELRGRELEFLDKLYKAGVDMTYAASSLETECGVSRKRAEALVKAWRKTKK